MLKCVCLSALVCVPGCYEHHGQSSAEVQRQRVFLQGFAVSFHSGRTERQGNSHSESDSYGYGCMCDISERDFNLCMLQFGSSGVLVLCYKFLYVGETTVKLQRADLTDMIP